MYVDPQIKAFVDDLAALDMPHPVELGLDATRDGFSQLWQQVNPATREAVLIDEIEVPGPAGDIRTMVYTPQGEGPFPVLIFFHGGGCCWSRPD